MKAPEVIFREICDAPDPEAAVRDLRPHELVRLITWLKAGHGDGIPGMVLALANLEAAERFVKAHP